MKERRQEERAPGQRKGRSPDDLSFVKLISHELRGPTTVLRGHLSMWLEGGQVPFPEELSNHLRWPAGRAESFLRAPGRLSRAAPEETRI